MNNKGSRLLYWAFCALLFTAFLQFSWWVWWFPPSAQPPDPHPLQPEGPLVEAFASIQLGMKPAEVQATIGAPPGVMEAKSSRTGGGLTQGVRVIGAVGLFPGMEDLPKGGTREQWYWRDYSLDVAYDDQQRVVGNCLL